MYQESMFHTPKEPRVAVVGATRNSNQSGLFLFFCSSLCTLQFMYLFWIFRTMFCTFGCWKNIFGRLFSQLTRFPTTLIHSEDLMFLPLSFGHYCVRKIKVTTVFKLCNNLVELSSIFLANMAMSSSSTQHSHECDIVTRHFPRSSVAVCCLACKAEGAEGLRYGFGAVLRCALQWWKKKGTKLKPVLKSEQNRRTGRSETS